MKVKTLIIFVICFFCIHFAQAQLINCGIQYFYDAAGNRVLRMIVPCANGGSNPSHNASRKDSTLATSDSTALATFQIVMINPNPTAGPFNITCNQELNNPSVSIIDLKGQVVSQSTVSGMTIPMDISRLTPGVYTVTVTSNGSPTTKTLVKMSGH